MFSIKKYLIYVQFLLAIFVLFPDGISSKPEGLVRVNRSSRPLDDILRKIESVESLVKEIKSAHANDQLTTKCVRALDEDNFIAANKYWKRSIQLNKVLPIASAIDAVSNNLNVILSDVYRGKPKKISTVLKFLEENNTTFTSDQTTKAYKILLKEMKDYGDLYIKSNLIPTSGESHLTASFQRYTFSTLRRIQNNLGAESDILKSVGPAGLAVLSGKIVTIKNKLTGNALFLQNHELCDGKSCSFTPPAVVTKKFSTGGENVTDYLWRFIPVPGKFEDNIEVFYIENAGGTRRLRVGLTVVDAGAQEFQELHKNWVQFLVHLVSETEVMIQCSFWGLKTLIMDDDNITTKLDSRVHGTEIANTARWVVEVFEES